MSSDTSVSIHPYFKIKPGQADAFRAHCRKFVERTRSEPGCLFYGFTFTAGDEAHCREAYVNADGLLAHLDNVADLIEGNSFSETIRLELHGPAAELEKLRQRFKDAPVQWFTLECGFRK